MKIRIPLDKLVEYNSLIKKIDNEKDVGKLFKYIENNLKYILERSKNRKIEEKVINILDNIKILKEIYGKGLNFIERYGIPYEEYNKIYLDLLKDINRKLIGIRIESEYMNSKELGKSLDNFVKNIEKITNKAYYIKDLIEELKEEGTLPEELKRKYFNRALSYLKT